MALDDYIIQGLQFSKGLKTNAMQRGQGALADVPFFRILALGGLCSFPRPHMCMRTSSLLWVLRLSVFGKPRPHFHCNCDRKPMPDCAMALRRRHLHHDAHQELTSSGRGACATGQPPACACVQSRIWIVPCTSAGAPGPFRGTWTTGFPGLAGQGLGVGAPCPPRACTSVGKTSAARSKLNK